MATTTTTSLAWLQPDETADVLLRKARIRPVPTGIDFLDSFFGEGLAGGEVLEISGATQTGKSEVCLQMLFGMLLPSEHNGIAFGGRAQSVLFLDIDGHFPLWRLTELLEQHIARAVCAALDDYELSPDAIHLVFGGEDGYFSFVRDCLARLSLIRIPSPFRLLLTVKALHHAFLAAPSNAQTPPYRLLIVDNLSSFNQASRSDLELAAHALEDYAAAARVSLVITAVPKRSLLRPTYLLSLSSARDHTINATLSRSRGPSQEPVTARLKIDSAGATFV